jgi:hypothetical protein
MKLIRRIRQYDTYIGETKVYKTIDHLTNVALTLATSALMLLVIAHVVIGVK